LPSRAVVCVGSFFTARGRKQCIQHTIFCRILRSLFYIGEFLLAMHFDRTVYEVANNRFDVLADVAHLSEFCRFYFNKGRVG